MTSDFDWLSSHGNYTADQHEYFVERVGMIMDSAVQKTPGIEWQARMQAWQELRVSQAQGEMSTKGTNSTKKNR